MKKFKIITVDKVDEVDGRHIMIEGVSCFTHKDGYLGFIVSHMETGASICHEVTRKRAIQIAKGIIKKANFKKAVKLMKERIIKRRIKLPLNP